MKKILFTIQINPEQKTEVLNKTKADLIFMDKKEVNEGSLNEVDAVIGNVKAELLNKAPNLKWVQLESAGADQHAKQLREEIMLTNATGAYGPAIAEHMMSGVFYFYKKLNLYTEAQKQHLWQNQGQVDCVGEATVCLIGYGDIGQCFAQRMKALGCKIIGIKRTSTPAPYTDELYTMDQIKEVLPKADIIAISLPNTAETYQCINEEILRSCKKSAVLMNVGRGSTLDTHALMKVLDQGWFKGVLLDVTDPEPLPINHPLWRYPNVVITPHVSGNYNMPQTLDRVFAIAIENINHFINEEKLINPVNRTTGYKESN